jgi:hypothetical protein
MADVVTEPTVVPFDAALGDVTKERAATGNDRPHAARERDQITDDPAAPKPGRGAAAQPAGPQKPDPQPSDGPRPFRIKDIQVGKADGPQIAVTHIYACQSDEYAIYKAEQVMVAYGDNPEKAQSQRKLILPLSTTRAELNSRLLGLDHREVFDQKLAYALQSARVRVRKWVAPVQA